MIKNTAFYKSQKEQLNNLIILSKKQLNNINNEILTTQQLYGDYINIIKTFHFIETYKWKTYKTNFNDIKNNVTINKRHYRKIAKKYSNIISYYNSCEIDSINKHILIIKNLTDDIIYNFSILRQTHIYTRVQITNIKARSQTIIINDNQPIKHIIEKIYMYYNEIKNIKKSLYGYNTLKLSLLNEINILEQKLKH